MLILREESFSLNSKNYILYIIMKVLRKQNEEVNFYVCAFKDLSLNSTSEQKCLNDNFINIV